MKSQSQSALLVFWCNFGNIKRENINEFLCQLYLEYCSNQKFSNLLIDTYLYYRHILDTVGATNNQNPSHNAGWADKWGYFFISLSANILLFSNLIEKIFLLQNQLKKMKIGMHVPTNVFQKLNQVVNTPLEPSPLFENFV